MAQCSAGGRRNTVPPSAQMTPTGFRLLGTLHLLGVALMQPSAARISQYLALQPSPPSLLMGMPKHEGRVW
jgi:hypothetical protein